MFLIIFLYFTALTQAASCPVELSQERTHSHVTKLQHNATIRLPEAGYNSAIHSALVVFCCFFLIGLS